ncbi:MAG: hypothetical protein DRQ39_00835 [Gammaproteobacteria bacterium]|nr:MAG: hypothetical protein DRQ39_00835 [Gammaproteobacteria bacterium]RKZ96176.1 MAG: hypothetical protein DRQ40_01700 [Gammaproteobacteria bacterium]
MTEPKNEELAQIFEDQERLPQTDPVYGDMFDGTVPGQSGSIRPRDFGYYEYLPEQRFSLILGNYILVMLALENNDITNITDTQFAWLAWGMNDEDALDAGYRFAAEEGWLDQYHEWFGGTEPGEEISEVTGWPRYNGEDDGYFEQAINAKLDHIDTIDRASRTPEPTVWRTLSQDAIGVGGTPGTAQWGFNAALHGGNMSELQQGIEKNTVTGAKIAIGVVGALAGWAIVGSTVAGSVAAASPMLTRVAASMAATPAGKKFFEGAMKFRNMIFGTQQLPGVQGAAGLTSGSINTANYASRLPSMGPEVRALIVGSGIATIGTYSAALSLGYFNDDAATLFADIKAQVEAGTMEPEMAALMAAAISGMTSEAIPDTLLGLEGFEDIAADKSEYQALKAEAVEKLKEKLVRPILGALYDDTPQPVTGDAADWEDSVVLASAFGIDVFAQSAETTDGWLTPSTTIGDGTGTTTTTLGDPGADEADEDDDDGFEGSLDSATGEAAEGIEYTIDQLAAMTKEERDKAIQPSLDAYAENFPEYFRSIEGNEDASDSEVAEALEVSVTEQYDIIMEQLKPEMLRIQSQRYDDWSKRNQAERARRGAPVGGQSEYNVVQPTITPRQPTEFDEAFTAPGLNIPSTQRNLPPGYIHSEPSGYTPRYFEGTYQSIMAGWSIAQIEWFQEQAIAAGMIDPERRYSVGQRDAVTTNAFYTLIGEANNNGNTWEDQLQGNIDSYRQWQSENPSGSGRDPYPAFVSPTYIAPDYATLAQATKSHAAETLGRRLSQAEMALLTDELRGLDKQQWNSQTQADRQTHAANARAYDDQVAGGGGEQAGGTTQGVDSEARFLQLFDEKFSGEIKHRERVDQAGMKNAGFFGSIANVEGNL